MVNKRFFMDTMKDRQMSLREVAKRIDVWPAALSRSLDGKRKMQIAEAVSLAQVLNIPLPEVLQNAGIQEAKTVGRRCNIIGHLTEAGVVEPIPVGVIERTPIPDSLPDEVVAVQAHTARSQAAYCDGWLTFFSEEHNPIAVIGHFVLAHLEDGSMRSGALRRGYESGTYNLLGPIYGHLKNIRIKSARRAILTIHS